MTTTSTSTPTAQAPEPATQFDHTPPALPPGPRKLPYIGNLLSLRQNPLGYLQQLQRTYGSMATIHLGRQPVVAMFEPAYVRHVLVEHPRDFLNSGLGGPNNEGFANEGLLTIDGEKHREQRRAVLPAFHKKRIENYSSIMEQYTTELLASWQSGETIDFSRAMQELTLRIVSRCLFSVDLSLQLEPLGTAFSHMLGSSTSIAEDLLNIRIDNPITGYGKRQAATRQLNTLIYTMIAQRRTDTSEHNDILSMLMEAPSGDPDAPTLTDKQIHDHVLTFLAAGHETTAINLVWTCYLLAEHPQVRVRLLDELRTVLAGRAPTPEDLTNLPYLDWVMSESLRLYPPAWMQARFLSHDIELDDVPLPAGTMIMLSQWVIQRRPDIWGDPEAFRPERWDPAHPQNIPPGAYFPFGGGPRTCIGMSFAQMEAKVLLAMILQQYIPQPVPGYQPGLQPTITLRPKHNLRVTLQPANASSAAAPEERLPWNRSRNLPTLQGERQGCLLALLNLIGIG